MWAPMKLTYISTALVLLAFGCGGGGGGASSDAELGSLSMSDQVSECNNLASEFPPKTVDCGLGSDNPTVGEDASFCSGSDFTAYPSSCTATVGDAEACEGDIYNEGSAFCSGTIPDSCAPLFGSDCTGQ